MPGSKLYRLGEVGTGSLAHDVNRWWHKVLGKENPYLKIGEVNDRTKSVSSVQRPASRVQRQKCKCPRTSTLVPRLHTLFQLSTARPWSLDSPKAPPSHWVYALKDVSFEVKRGELRTLGRSEKEISKKCLGATKVPDSGRRRHQLLGIIGRNGAARKARGRQDYRTAGRRTGRMTPVNQAAWQSLGRLPQAA